MIRFGKFLLGPTLPSSAAAKERLPIPIALAVLSSDVLSSCAYATDELLAVLVLGGAMALGWSVPISAAIVALLAVLVVSYRQLIRAYPSGGGAYTVAKENLGVVPGLVAASGLLIDYVLTVSVSIAAGVAAMTSAFPVLAPVRVELCIALLGVMMVGNLRGVRESGRLFALPTFFFVGSIFMLLAAGLVRFALGQTSAAVAPAAAPEVATSLSLFLLLRAFSSGCAALTGTEAISNAVKVFKKPEQDNARKTMLFMGLALGTMFLGITLLARAFGVVPTADQTVVSQIAHIALGNGPLYYVVQFSTLLILLMAANTSFADFPRVASMLGADRYLPNQLSDIGSRLVYSNGIVLLASLSGVLIVVFRGDTSSLIPLYAVGVFVSFTLSQSGMVVHWYRQRSSGWVRAALINGVGAVATGIALAIIATTKFTHGAWFVLLLIPASLFLFSRIHRHYEGVSHSLAYEDWKQAATPQAAPGRPMVVMLVSGAHKGVRQALDYAKTISNDVRSVYVDCEGAGKADKLWGEWAERVPDVPLIVLPSPNRELVAPVLAYLQRAKATSNDLVTVVIPEFITGHWWTRLLHRRMAAKLKSLLYQHHIPVVSVTFTAEPKRDAENRKQLDDPGPAGRPK